MATQSAGQKAKAKALSAKRKAEKEIAEQVAQIEAARKAAEGMEVTSASEWKQSAGRAPTKLMLPSGKVCLARNTGLEAFLEGGLIPNSLLPIVTAAVQEGKGLDPAKAESLAEDPAMLADIMLLVNRVVCHSVVEPKVIMPPEDEADRDDDLLYVDEVDLADRMFIMQWVSGGTKDLERFRSEPSADVEGVAALEAVEGQAE